MVEHNISEKKIKKKGSLLPGGRVEYPLPLSVNLVTNFYHTAHIKGVGGEKEDDYGRET